MSGLLEPKDQNSSIYQDALESDNWNPDGMNLTEEELTVEDNQLEEILDETRDRFGIDYDEVVSHAGWGDLEGNALGQTEYEVEDIEKIHGNLANVQDDTRILLDSGLKDILEDYRSHPLTEEDIYHIAAHEGEHAEIFDGRYATELRKRGMPITTLMALGSVIDGSEENHEAVTEYLTRLRNPELENTQIQAYDDLVRDLESYLEDVEAYVTEERKEMIEGADELEGADIEYVEAGGDFYLEHGETEEGEYVLILGESENAENYLEEKVDEGEVEVFRGERPYDEDLKHYDDPEIEEFEKYMEESIDDFDPDDDFDGGDGGSPLYTDVLDEGGTDDFEEGQPHLKTADSTLENYGKAGV